MPSLPFRTLCSERQPICVASPDWRYRSRCASSIALSCGLLKQMTPSSCPGHRGWSHSILRQSVYVKLNTPASFPIDMYAFSSAFSLMLRQGRSHAVLTGEVSRCVPRCDRCYCVISRLVTRIDRPYIGVRKCERDMISIVRGKVPPTHIQEATNPQAIAL